MKLFILVLFSCVTNPLFSQHQENANTIIKQNHFTKEMVFLYSYKNNVPEKVPSVCNEILYNNEGDILERKFFHNNKLQHASYFYYDANNKLLSEAMYNASNANKPLFTRSYKYDLKGNEIGFTDSGYRGPTILYDTLKVEGYSTKTFNNKNELIQEIYNTDHFYNKIDYTYNDDGTINQRFCYSKNNELTQTETYTYKKNGDVELYVLDKTGKSKKVNERFYNKDKQLVKQVAYFYKSTITEYSYNADGTLFEKKSSFNGVDINLERHYYRPIGTNLNF